MISVGVDIEDISRFKNKTLERDSKFLFKIFTQNELDYCFSNSNPAPNLCARFCAKEAVVKAMSSKYDKLIPYNKIEILKNEKGAPCINILIDELRKYDFSLSISHEKEKAIAFVVVS